MPAPSVLILRAPGTNCDAETAFAFQRAGATVSLAHVNQLRERPRLLARHQILAIPGGFSFGDDVAAGRILAAQLQNDLSDAVREFRDADKLVLGICNGFQALLRSGLLVPPDEDGPLASLGVNTVGRFVDNWTTVTVASDRSPFLIGIRQMRLPVAHGEGRFVCRKTWILDGLSQTGQVALRYAGGSTAGNPSGSTGDVAGLCDPTGRVLGLMPHPERFVLPTQSPSWSRDGLGREGDGLQLFRNAVEFFDQ